MQNVRFDDNYVNKHKFRINNTLRFAEGFLSPNDRILDLGPKNSLSKIMVEKGYEVTNTPFGVDLDDDYEIVMGDFDVVTSFEIFEHMVSPYPLLKSISAKRLIASVPLKLWFANAYWNTGDSFDCHYHEFESKQFDMLLEKAGWKILKSEKWVSKVTSIGFRPILRRFFPRYYIVYCERD